MEKDEGNCALHPPYNPCKQPGICTTMKTGIQVWSGAMLESERAGYGPSKHHLERKGVGVGVDSFERVIRTILVICFMGVLGLELWLLISAFGSG
jgi:hypothetical protein